jgi:hypothetical protein
MPCTFPSRWFPCAFHIPIQIIPICLSHSVPDHSQMPWTFCSRPFPYTRIMHIPICFSDAFRSRLFLNVFHIPFQIIPTYLSPCMCFRSFLSHSASDHPHNSDTSFNIPSKFILKINVRSFYTYFFPLHLPFCHSFAFYSFDPAFNPLAPFSFFYSFFSLPSFFPLFFTFYLASHYILLKIWTAKNRYCYIIFNSYYFNGHRVSTLELFNDACSTVLGADSFVVNQNIGLIIVELTSCALKRSRLNICELNTSYSRTKIE